ncbi:MAG: MBL fold metallo-hydrolase [Candidatus Bathyarchaeota archaeon]|nr:MAG: MBL fold metallo-hydrolase [Candidatus Bathyarchaeota archaeon]
MVKIIWHGHACFELRGIGSTLIFDPFAGIGIPEPKAQADIVLCSHNHRDHNNASQVVKKGGTVLETYTGPYTYFNDVLIQGIATFHDETEGSKRGRNSVYVVQLDHLTFCHLGDLGHDLTDRQIKWIGSVDVLFTPIGGGPTIGPDLATLLSEKLEPKIIIPMHYNPHLLGVAEFLNKLQSVNEFIKNKKNVKKLESPAYCITQIALPLEPIIVVLLRR